MYLTVPEPAINTWTCLVERAGVPKGVRVVDIGMRVSLDLQIKEVGAQRNQRVSVKLGE